MPIKISKKLAPGKLPLKYKLIILIMPVVILVLFEIFLRLVGYSKPYETYDPFDGFTKNYKLYCKKYQDGKLVYIPAPAKCNTGSRYLCFKYSEFPVKKAPNTIRIFCLGGSAALGAGSKKAFSDFLSEKLKRFFPLNNFEVINAAVGGYGSYRVALLAEELVDYNPDLFILYSGNNEYFESMVYSMLFDIYRNPLVFDVAIVLEKSRLYQLLKKLIIPNRQFINTVRRYTVAEKPPSYVFPALLKKYGRYYTKLSLEQLHSSILENYRLDIEKLIDNVKGHNIKIILLNVPSNLKFPPSVNINQFNGENQASHNLSYERGKDLLARGCFKEAVLEFEVSETIFPHNPYASWYAGICYEKLGRYKEAKDAYNKARDNEFSFKRAPNILNEELKCIAQRNNVIFVDIISAFEKIKDKGIFYEQLFLDHCHPTMEAHEIIANEIIKRVKEEGLIK